MRSRENPGSPQVPARPPVHKQPWNTARARWPRWLRRLLPLPSPGGKLCYALYYL